MMAELHKHWSSLSPVTEVAKSRHCLPPILHTLSATLSCGLRVNKEPMMFALLQSRSSTLLMGGSHVRSLDSGWRVEDYGSPKRRIWLSAVVQRPHDRVVCIRQFCRSSSQCPPNGGLECGCVAVHFAERCRRMEMAEHSQRSSVLPKRNLLSRE